MKRYVVFGSNFPADGGAVDYLLDFGKLVDALTWRRTYLLERPGRRWCHVWDQKEHKLYPTEEDEYGPVVGTD